MTNSKLTSDLDAVRAQLHNARGPQLWRSLDQMADTPAFRDLVEREFPQGASELNDPVSRRSFLKLMGASLALAGISGCTYMPRTKIAPFVHQPLGRVPGVPLFYASSVLLNGFATGVLVRSNDGRPTKIEPNPQHPGSAGGTDLFVQAELLTMYDPDRSTQVLNAGAASTWDAFTAALASALQAQSGGAGLRLLTTTVTSPTLASQIGQLLAQYPQARWYQYDPINRDNVYEGARLAFGEDVTTRYDLSKAQVILSLDADFLAPGPGFAAYARAFAEGRRVRKDSGEMNRLYVVEASPSGTGATADHRLPIQAGQVAGFAQALAAKLGVAGVSEGPNSEAATRFLTALVEDLEAHKGSSLVVAGDQQPPIVHALAHAINAKLGNVGSTVIYTDPVEARPTNQTAEIASLGDEIDAGAVGVLVIIGGNPAYNAPGDLRFAERLAKVPLSAHLSLFNDETSTAATWHIPATHSLESWSDARAYDGTAGIIQPLIEPLFGGKTSHEIVAALLGQPLVDPLTIVQGYWQGKISGDFATAWQEALSNGLINGTAATTRTPTLKEGGLGGAAPAPGALEIVFRPDPSIWDGSYANNGWLMELPRPLTKLVWDNAALMSPRTAISLLKLPFSADQLTGGSIESQHYLEALSAVNGKVVRLSYRGSSIDLPLWLLPGHAENSITVNLGYGRSQAGTVGNGVGVNAYPVRTSAAPWFDSLAADAVSDTGETYLLVSTQDHWTMEGRDIYRVGKFAEFKADPEYIQKEVFKEEFGGETHKYDTLLPGTDYAGRNAWGMTFNLNACVGCNACVVACQAENNIPVIGKEQVSVGREMQWLRIDRYFAGNDLDNPDTYLMPIACMQCERAPCELVCPVAATVHDYEGLNNMVYNRCVGTKYCSNNCPYKVRRFNFLQYTDLSTATLQLARNPNVTVRNRGIMEKCTYCVQRISSARIDAKKAAVAAGSEAYTIADDAIITACEAACPTAAITFGDINNKDSRVASWKSEPHNYSLLQELNTIPRTTYLARIRNPFEALSAADTAKNQEG
ncbi:MAG: TAT-variant-translocated molybdopterin oxidoreductase [Chloroflexales bacterium]